METRAWLPSYIYTRTRCEWSRVPRRNTRPCPTNASRTLNLSPLLKTCSDSNWPIDQTSGRLLGYMTYPAIRDWSSPVGARSRRETWRRRRVHGTCSGTRPDIIFGRKMWKPCRSTYQLRCAPKWQCVEMRGGAVSICFSSGPKADHARRLWRAQCRDADVLVFIFLNYNAQRRHSQHTLIAMNTRT